jgi:hypothetical protein
MQGAVLEYSGLLVWSSEMQGAVPEPGAPEMEFLNAGSCSCVSGLLR